MMTCLIGLSTSAYSNTIAGMSKEFGVVSFFVVSSSPRPFFAKLTLVSFVRLLSDLRLRSLDRSECSRECDLDEPKRRQEGNEKVASELPLTSPRFIYSFNASCAIAPLILAPLCELIGRREVYLTAYGLFVLCFLFLGESILFFFARRVRELTSLILSSRSPRPEHRDRHHWTILFGDLRILRNHPRWRNPRRHLED